MLPNLNLNHHRTNIIVSGGLGLLAGLIMMIGCIVVNYMWLSQYVLSIWIVGGTFFVCLLLSLLEMPLMIFSLRQITKSERENVRTLTLFGNGIFVFFGMVYAVPNLLMTYPDFWWFGGVLASLTLVRFLISIVFLDER